MTDYAWIIDNDHAGDNTGLVSDNAPDDLVAVLASGRGRQFRIFYTWDGGHGGPSLYYEGRWVGPNWACHDGRWLDETALLPLTDFAEPGTGANSIWYRANGDNSGPWVQLSGVDIDI